MSNELATKNATGTLVVRDMDDLARLGNMLAQSGYFKDAADAAQAGVKVLAGLEMGIGAFSAMSGIHIIEGKPSIGAGLMAAAVKRHPKYDYRLRKHSATECEIEFFEAGESVGVSTFTIEDAKRAELKFQSFKGTPTAWAKNPRNMLFARALSNGVRWYCPDVFDVSTYTPEELGAEVDDEGEPVRVERVPSRPEKPAAALGAPKEAPAPEPAPEPATTTTAPSSMPGGDSPIIPSQVRAITEDVKAQGLDASTARAFMSWLFERPIGGVKELSTGEASLVLAWDEPAWNEALADYAVFAAGGPPEDEAEPDWSDVPKPDEAAPIEFDPSGKTNRKPRKEAAA